MANMLLATICAVACIALQAEVNQWVYRGELNVSSPFVGAFGRLVSQKVTWVYLGYWVVIAFTNVVISSKAFEREARRREELEDETRISQLRILQNQMRPHFLFNCLNALVSMLPEQSPSQEFTIRLSGLIRETLLVGARPLSTLAEELEFTRKYVEVEKTRFGERLVVRFDIEGGLDEQLLPTHVIQPLVENAVNYGVALTKEPFPITITVQRHPTEISIRIENAYVISNQKPSFHNGITHENCRKRLELLYGDAAILHCGRVGDSYECLLKVPIDQGNKRGG